MDRHDSLGGLKSLNASFFARKGAKEQRSQRRPRNAEFTLYVGENSSSSRLFCVLGPFASWRASYLPLGGGDIVDWQESVSFRQF
jgi:hypothetical protein